MKLGRAVLSGPHFGKRPAARGNSSLESRPLAPRPAPLNGASSAPLVPGILPGLEGSLPLAILPIENRGELAGPSGREVQAQAATGSIPPSWRRMAVEGATAPPPPQPDNPRQKAPDYYANVGDCIRTLREDIPILFDHDITYDIYRDDIVFRDPRNTFHGKENYRLIFWSLRFHGRLFFSKLTVEVKRVWQTDDSKIQMRWQVRGTPRVPWKAEGIFDGVSMYKLDREGRIFEHYIDNVILRDPPVAFRMPLFSVQLTPAPLGGQPGAPIPGGFCEGQSELDGIATTATLGQAAARASPAPAAVAAAAPASFALSDLQEIREDLERLIKAEPMAVCPSSAADRELSYWGVLLALLGMKPAYAFARVTIANDSPATGSSA